MADVTDRGRMRIFNGSKAVCDLEREFIDSAGARHYSTVKVAPVSSESPFHRTPAGADLSDRKSVV